jgi:hypothetical protein
MVRLLILTLFLVLPSPAHAAWPVWPRNEQHPIRGGFGDLRWDGRQQKWDLHGGVDVAVDERERATSKVYALNRGRVKATTTTRKHPCGSVTIGRVQLGHVHVTVTEGQKIRKGQQVGWTCPDMWHVHVSEFRHGRQVNALRPGGVLSPYSDTAAPTITDIHQGEDGWLVRVEDPLSDHGWLEQIPALLDDDPPTLIILDGVLVKDLRWMPVPFMYDAKARRGLPVRDCLLTTDPCRGEHWFNLGPLELGTHELRALDEQGNRTVATFTVN